MNIVIFIGIVGVVGVVAVFVIEVKIGLWNPVVAIPAVSSTPSDGGNNDNNTAAKEGAE